MGRSLLIAPLLLAAVLLAVVLPGEHAALASRDAAPSFRPPGPGYHSLEEVAALVEGWIQADGARVRAVKLAPSAGGRAAPALEFGARVEGDRPLEERPTVFLLGGLDGRSRAGSEAVLRATHALLANLDALRPDVAFVCIPWASPDGLVRAAGGARAGADDAPVDDDEDGRADEDGPDDLDGDGEVLELVVEDPAGSWTFSSDPRFLVPARATDAPRLVRSREGRDDDGDGRWNEDGSGGIQLDAHFPVGWQGPGPLGRAGRFPLEDALARSIADLALERRTALVLVFQGQHGGVARPGGTLGAELAAGRDRASFDRVAEAYARATGRALDGSRSLREAHGAERPGAAIDWFHGALGALAVEVAVWGPEAVGRDGRAFDAGVDAPVRDQGLPAPDVAQRRWARWLDDVRGGLGFAAWRPIELGTGRRAWVGGWRDRIDLDPPDDALPFALEGTTRFVREVVDGLPRVEIDVATLERTGDLVRVRARAVNRGTFPTGLAGSARAARATGPAAGAVTLRFEPPCDDALVAGERVYRLGVLPGGGSGPEHDWLVLAPPGTTLRLTVEAPALIGAQREVRP